MRIAPSANQWLLVATGTVAAATVGLRQGILRGLVCALAVFGALALGLVIRRWARRSMLGAPLLLAATAALVLALWWRQVDATHIWQDISAAAVGYGLALKFTFTTSWHGMSARERPSLLAGVVAFLISSWLILGTFDLLLSQTTTHFREISRPSGFAQNTHSGRRVGLALSGGGYRAALYHSGVVFELQQQAVPIDIISSVSGGSIFAAALHSGLSPRQFIQAVVDGRLNLARAVATPTYVLPALTNALIPRRLHEGRDRTVAPDRSRRAQNARLLERAFGYTYVLEGSPSSTVPWIIAMTDLNRARVVGAAPGWTVFIPLARSGDRSLPFQEPERTYDAYGKAQGFRCRISAWYLGGNALAAASGAFPLAFEPLMSSLEPCTDDLKGKFGLRLDLVDGGVIDNSGVVVLEALADVGPSIGVEAPALIIASDGGSAAALLGERGDAQDLMRMMESPSGLGGAAHTLDLLSSLPGAAYRPRNGPSARVVSISPKALMPRSEGRDTGYSYALAPEMFAERFSTLSSADLRLVSELVASSDSQAQEFYGHANSCVTAARSPTTNSVADRATMDCLLTGGGEQSLYATLDGMLMYFADAKTLDARYSDHEADTLFRLGRLMAVLAKSQLQSHLAALE